MAVSSPPDKPSKPGFNHLTIPYGDFHIQLFRSPLETNRCHWSITDSLGLREYEAGTVTAVGGSPDDALNEAIAIAERVLRSLRKRRHVRII